MNVVNETLRFLDLLKYAKDVIQSAFSKEHLPDIETGQSLDNNDGNAVGNIIDDADIDDANIDDVTLPSFSSFNDVDPLEYAKPFQTTETVAITEMEQVTTDTYHMLMTFACAGLVFSLIFAGVRLMLHGIFQKPSTKEEVFSAIGAKALAFAALCSIALLVGILGEVISSINI